MWKVDTVKKIVFELRGVDCAKVSNRCKEIHREDLEKYAILKYRYFDLSEWVLVDEIVVGRSSFNSKADAEYERKRLGLDRAVIRRASDVVELM